MTDGHRTRRVWVGGERCTSFFGEVVAVMAVAVLACVWNLCVEE